MNRHECPTNPCWNKRCHFNHKGFDKFGYSRCRSGKRWFWVVQHWTSDWPTIGSGWEATEDDARAAAEKVISGAAGDQPISVHVSAGFASDRLKEINKARRAARPPAETSEQVMVEYLYDCGGRAYRIIRRTAKRIFYVKGEHYGEEETGFVDRRLVFDEWPADPYRFETNDSRGRRRSGYSCFWTKPHPVSTPVVKSVDLRTLKAEMAAAHPDRGGSSDAFIEARRRYEEAKSRREVEWV
jgi:hypothetical protein